MHDESSLPPSTAITTITFPSISALAVSLPLHLPLSTINQYQSLPPSTIGVVATPGTLVPPSKEYRDTPSQPLLTAIPHSYPQLISCGHRSLADRRHSAAATVGWAHHALPHAARCRTGRRTGGQRGPGPDQRCGVPWKARSIDGKWFRHTKFSYNCFFAHGNQIFCKCSSNSMSS